MSATSSSGLCLVPLDKQGLSTATVYVKGFGTNDGKFGDWLEQHEKLKSTRGWRSDVFGCEWPSGSETKMKFLSATVWSTLWFLAQRYPKVALAGAIARLVAGAVPLSWLWNYKKAEKNAIEFGPYFADEIRKLNRDYETVRVVAHSLGCRLMIEAAAELPQEYLPSQAHLLAPACREDSLRSRIARDRTWLYHTEKDWVLRYLFPLPFVSGGEAMGAVGLKRSYPGLTAVDVSDQFGFGVHREYRNRFADMVEREEEPLNRGQEVKVFLPARERFEPRTEKSSNAPMAADERAVERAQPAKKKTPAGLGASSQKGKRVEQGTPLPSSKEWSQAQKRGARKQSKETTDANMRQEATSTTYTRQESAKRAMDRINEWWAAQEQLEKEREKAAASQTEAKQDGVRKAPEIKGVWKRWVIPAALTGAAAVFGIPYI